MAATKLIAMHQNKGRSVMRCLKDRTDYAMNGEKTDEGKYISSYQCNPELVDLEFAQAKKEYLHKTWRQPKGDVIAYETTLGIRYYTVDTIETISDDDWSYLGRTEDNRITLITCEVGHDDKRLVVQAVEF